jgi:hypothetical protein
MADRLNYGFPVAQGVSTETRVWTAIQWPVLEPIPTKVIWLK